MQKLFTIGANLIINRKFKKLLPLASEYKSLSLMGKNNFIKYITLYDVNTKK